MKDDSLVTFLGFAVLFVLFCSIAIAIRDGQIGMLITNVILIIGTILTMKFY